MAENKKGIGFKDGQHETYRAGTNYLFTIGIDKYEHCSTLYNAVKDATDVTNILFQKYNFDRQHHFCLEDEAATKDNIIETFRKIKKTLKKNDNLIIYYSGHGELDRDFDESYWVTVESRKGKIGDYLSLESLVKYIRAIKTHHTLIIIDACFAGAALVERRNAAEALERDPSRYVIASGRKEFAADGTPGENSPFAKALLKKLKDSQEALTAMSLGEYVKTQTIKATKKTQRPIHNPLQIPDDEGGEFVFHPKAANEDTVWQSIQERNTLTAYRSYRKKYEQGKYAEEALWQIAVLRNRDTAYDDYLEHYPNGNYATEADKRMLALEEASAWADAQQRNSLLAYRKFVRTYPKSEHCKTAKANIKIIKDAANEEQEEVIETPVVKKAPQKIIQPTPHIIKDPNLFVDPRDGQEYKTVKLKDGKIWLAENLNFEVKDSWYHKEVKSDADKKKYGHLYTWQSAQQACPDGWRLPSDEEWRAMAKYYGGCDDDASDGGKAAYKALMPGGSTGFSAQLGGSRYSRGSYYNFGEYGNYWSSTELDAVGAWRYSFYSDDSTLYRSYDNKSWARSCRCLKG